MKARRETTFIEKEIPTRKERAKEAAKASFGYDPNVRLEREIPKGMPPKKKPKKPMSRIGQFYQNFCLNEIQQLKPPSAAEIKARKTRFETCKAIYVIIAKTFAVNQ